MTNESYGTTKIYIYMAYGSKLHIMDATRLKDLQLKKNIETLDPSNSSVR